MDMPFQLAAYYFPNYHRDARNDAKHGAGWSEWDLVRFATPRFPGHQQPRIPVWGYEDEADPAAMDRKILSAAQHGLSAFIFDWYWYEDGPYLQRALDDGFLSASHQDRLKFAIMWANHDWVDIHPALRNGPRNTLYSGRVSETAFLAATEHAIRHYFTHPSYWRVGGGLYFSVYEIVNLARGLGGLDSTRRILAEFRERVMRAGLGKLHLNAVMWGVQNLPNETKVENPNELLEFFGFDSVTSYVWVHHQVIRNFPSNSYASYRDANLKDFERLSAEFRLPYHPNVTVGWDPSPRTIQTDVYDNLGYPYTPVLVDNTPDEFKIALRAAKHFLKKRGSSDRILTINAWNEWTEGSYLEPDLTYDMGYLEAIREVFVEEEEIAPDATSRMI